MRRRSPRPGWVVPTLCCGIATVGLAALGFYFRSEIAAVETSGPPFWSMTGADAPRPVLGSEAVDLSDDGANTRSVRMDDVVDALGQMTEDDSLVTDGSVWVDPASSGRSWHDLGAVDGLLTFRGNPTRTFYGMGPVPRSPRVMWTMEVGCSESSVGSEEKVWCGSGWTGQPAMFPAPDGVSWWLAFGGYNRAVNFLDPTSGTEVLPPFYTNDIIKGSVTIDPDGYPLVYSGSRDDYFHVIAIDGAEPRELWKLSAEAVQPTLWNNDWDGSSLVIDDYLFEGGENGRFFIVRLNRGFGTDGLVTVNPEIVFSTESWDDQLLADLGDRQVSVENSVAISGDVVYFTNSGGLVQGWDISGLTEGAVPQQVFRFWAGDDTDASVVVDDEGMLYVAAEYERGTQRSVEVGQIMKLDPSRPDDPLVWSHDARNGLDSGVWATPAIHGDVLIVPTDDGEVFGIDRATGDDLWQLELPGPLWSSPVVVDDVWIQGDCNGTLHAFDVSDPTAVPTVLWEVPLEGCIESTPAVWGGGIFVGTRVGRFYALGDG